jgi:hypothetical protein
MAKRQPRSRPRPRDHRERLWDRAKKNRAAPSAIFFQKTEKRSDQKHNESGRHAPVDLPAN